MIKKLYIKGFDKDLCCKGYQFEIGKTYDTGHTENLKLCTEKVFHFCETLQQVHKFYTCNNENNRFCYIEVLGELVEDVDKCGSNKIRIIKEIKGKELEMLKGITNGNTGLFNTGNRNTGDCNTGNCNTGYYNTGDWNTGDCNTGDRNTGYYNTGDWNTGDCNTGDRNTGDRNTGYYNTGDWNTGYWNSCNYSTGFFNTKERTITIFNVDSGMTFEEFLNSEYCSALKSGSFKLTEWVEYTDEEKANSIVRQAIGGYLKKYTYKEACKNWWASLSNKDKQIIQKIPNFNKNIFFEITGIEL